jgi:hypothetical protein
LKGKSGIVNHRQYPGLVQLVIDGRLPVTLSRKKAWEIYLSMQSYFAAQPRNKRMGNTCPDCVPPKVIDDRATHCRNHRVRKGKVDETANP